MPPRLTDNDIAIRIAPTAQRWPAIDTIAYRALRDGVAALRQRAAALDEAAAAVETDDSLSAEGVRRKRAALGIAALKQLAAFEPYLRAKKSVAYDIEYLESKMDGLPQRPADAVAAAEEMELRAFIRHQKSPIDFVIKRLSDQRVLAAVWNSALPDLTGLTQAELDHVRARARRTLHPEQSATVEALGKAMVELDGGMAAMRRLICERCEVRVDADGEARGSHEPAPAPRLTRPVSATPSSPAAIAAAAAGNSHAG